jgi:hypothetical protein
MISLTLVCHHLFLNACALDARFQHLASADSLLHSISSSGLEPASPAMAPVVSPTILILPLIH